jgi:DNA-binding CsgD family transcriptional regulator
MSTAIAKPLPLLPPNGSASLNGSASEVAENGLLVTDMSLEVIAFDFGAACILQDSEHLSNGTIGEQSPRIPDEIRASLVGLDLAQLASTNISFTVGKYVYICRAFVVHPKNGPSGEPMLALYLRRDASVIDVVHLLARKYHLSDRETQALEAIATGQSSKETARQMQISPNTVKSFTRIIMIKTRVDTKAALIAKLLDYYRNGWTEDKGA